MLAVVDTGPLYAAVDADDADHARCVEILSRSDLRLIVPALVVTEVAYLVESRLGPAIEAAFLRGLSVVDVEAPRPDDWDRIAELVEIYRDFPLGCVDASVVTLAEASGTTIVITLDVRHFRAIRPRHCDTFQLLPDDA